MKTGFLGMGLLRFTPTSLIHTLRWMIWVGVCSVLLTGCIAQQADLARIQKDLERQIGNLKKEKKELGEQVEEARAAIIESQDLIALQKADMTKMRSALAPMNQQLKLLREQDLTNLYGKFEVAEKRVSDLETNLANATDEVQATQTKVQAHEEQLQTSNTQAATLAQQVDDNNQALTQTMTEFQRALEQFKGTMTELGSKIGDETQRATSAEAKFSTDLIKKVERVQTDLTTQKQEMENVRVHANELSKAIGQVSEALDQSGTLFESRLEERSAQLQAQIASLKDRVNSDTKALRTYLDQDVKIAMTQMVTDMENQQRPALERMNVIEKDIEALGSHVQAEATQMQNLSQTVVKLREAQDVMGSLLGKRGDEIIGQAGRLSERMNALETHQTEITQQIQSNTQKTTDHLTQVTDSLNSVSEALDQTRQSLSGRLTEQENTLNQLTQTAEQFQQLKTETQSAMERMKIASDLTDQLHNSVEQITARLQEMEIHQSGMVGKLDSDAQATNTHLQEVNQGITSIAQALEDVSGKLNARIDSQEQQVNQAMTEFQNSQVSAETAQMNVNHLNQLTDTVNQLREIVNTIGTKLGGRVDEHEDRLGQLATRVNRLQGKSTKN